MTPRLDQSSDVALLPRGVRRALDAMRANLEHDWSVTELADVAGASGRALQRQFQIFLAKTPHATLRDLRFDHARRELLQGSPDARVKDVAQRYGFLHYGRFSVEYRRRYRETPSRTLKRQATFIDSLASMPSLFASGHDRPTITFDPIDASSENGEIARHLADELTVALTRAGVSVASRPGSERYRLTGVMRGSGAKMHLTIRLVEAETGRHLSAYRCEDALGNDSTLDDRLATRIAGALQPHLRVAEIDRARRKPDDDLTPRDLTLRAMPGVLSLDADGNARALDLLERAMERDPGHALATALAAWAHVQRVVYHFTTDPLAERARSIDLAQKALTLAEDATVLAVLGNALTLLHEIGKADVVIRKALLIDGGSAWAWSRSGWLDVYSGNSESAIERLNIALDLAPHDSLAFNSMVGIGCAHFKAGNYLDAARWQERALAEHPSSTWVHRTLCPAYVLGGAKLQARRSLNALRDQYPDLTISEVHRGMPPLPQTYRDLVIEGLKSAGLPR